MTNLIVRNLLVPGSLSFILVIVGVVFMFLKKKKKGRYMIVAGLFIYYIFSITPGADFVIGNLEENFSTLEVDQIDQAEVIVVLSGGAKSDVLRSSEVLRISNLKDHSPTLIISGTEAIDQDRNSFSAVEAFFINRGIPDKNIYVEDQSNNTRENAKQVVEEVGEEPFFLVTSAYHMKRAVMEFEKLGANPIPAPTDFRKRRETYYFSDYIPSSENLRKSDLALHEHLGILYYRLFD
ncbi:MAG: YdcF family protein [Patescibacteria group bacterium]